MKISRVESGGRVRWMVYAGTVDGKRRRFYATNEKGAKIIARELEAERASIGSLWREMPPSTKTDLLNVLDEVEGEGLTLRGIWEHYQRTTDTSGINPTTLADAQREMVGAKRMENVRPSYLQTLDYCTAAFCRALTGWEVHSVTLENIQGYLAGFDNDSSRQSQHTRLATFMAFCKLRGYRLDNPFDQLKQPKVDYKRPAILSVDEARRFMAAAVALEPALVPSFALKLFAGVRPQEAARLKWADVRLETAELVIDSAASKVRDVRIVKLPANCVAWLTRYKRATGLVQPSIGYRKRWERVRARSGVSWAPDILRHSALSYWFEVQGAQRTANDAGTSERILFRHYRAQVTAKDAAAFYGIVP